MNTATVARSVQHASPAREYARGRVFYSGMAVAMGLTVSGKIRRAERAVPER